MTAIGFAGMHSSCYHNHIRLFKLLRVFSFWAGDREKRDFHAAERVAELSEVQKGVVSELVEEIEKLRVSVRDAEGKLVLLYLLCEGKHELKGF